jgi:hypothetical protein
MTTTLWTKHQYARCYGHWVVSDPECVKCALSDGCEKRTKAKVSEVDHAKEVEVDSGPEDVKTVLPLDYLLQSLGGKFDQETEEKEKERAIIHKFHDVKTKKVMIAVIVGFSGRVKIVSVPRNISKVLEGIDSIEQVELVLAEIL